jgi:hypothetical protein
MVPISNKRRKKRQKKDTDCSHWTGSLLTKGLLKIWTLLCSSIGQRHVMLINEIVFYIKKNPVRLLCVGLNLQVAVAYKFRIFLAYYGWILCPFWEVLKWWGCLYSACRGGLSRASKWAVSAHLYSTPSANTACYWVSSGIWIRSCHTYSTRGCFGTRDHPRHEVWDEANLSFILEECLHVLTAKNATFIAGPIC